MSAYLALCCDDLDQATRGFFCDEASIAYNAYSILRTGKDEHGVSWPSFFQAFGEYKSAPYIYSLSVVQFFVGMNQWSSRIPALAGIMLAIIVSCLLMYQHWGPRCVIILLFLLLGEPWVRQFSHVAFELTLSPLFVVATILALESLIRNPHQPLRYAAAAIFLSALACYNYMPTRVMMPLLVVGWMLISRSELNRAIENFSKREILSLALLFFALLLPITFAINRAGPQFLSRSAYLSIFTTEYVEQTWAWKLLSSSEWLKPYIEPAPLKTALVALLQYFSYYDPLYLFWEGETNYRFTVPGWGPFLPSVGLWLVVGLYTLIVRRNRFDKVLLLWFLLLGLPGALTWEDVPHSGRAVSSLLALDFIATQGIQTLITRLTFTKGIRRLTIGSLLVFGIGAQIMQFRDFGSAFRNDLNPKSLVYRQYGYLELFKKLADLREGSRLIVLAPSSFYYQPYIFALYSTQLDPEIWQREKTLPWGIITAAYPLQSIDFQVPGLYVTGPKPHEIPQHCKILDQVSSPTHRDPIFRIIRCANPDITISDSQ